MIQARAKAEPCAAIIVLIILLLLGLNGKLYARDNPTSLDKTFKKTWQKFADICDDAAPYAADESRGKKSALETITFREPKYVRLLKEAQNALGVSEATEHFQTIEKLRIGNNELESEITELKREKIMAPDTSYNPLASTRESIEKSIAKKKDKIQENENRIDKIKSVLIDVFLEHGINITPNELDYFLISAEGSELIHLMTIAGNMKRIHKIIGNELKNEPNNMDLAKIYTGMYLVSLDAYTNAHDTAINNIGVYRRKLKDIIHEAERNYKDAAKLRKQGSAREYPHLDANLNLNKRAIEVANAYDLLLQRRNNNLNKSRGEVKHRSDIARNTYRTLTNGSALIALVSEGENEYALLINFEMPEFERIYDSGMLNSFAEIAEKIRAEK